MITIKLKEFITEAASMGRGIEFKKVLEKSIIENEKVVVDFDGITRFASPFFNNSFSSLAIQYGFECVENIELINISEIGHDTYVSSLENAKLLYNNPEYREEIDDIVNAAPKKAEC